VINVTPCSAILGVIARRVAAYMFRGADVVVQPADDAAGGVLGCSAPDF